MDIFWNYTLYFFVLILKWYNIIWTEIGGGGGGGQASYQLRVKWLPALYMHFGQVDGKKKKQVIELLAIC